MRPAKYFQWLSLFVVACISDGFSVNSEKSMGSSIESCNMPTLPSVDRRSFLAAGIAMSPAVAGAAVPASRTVDVGGGFDLLGDVRLAQKDVLYPISMEGLWKCQRVVTQVEGDSFQAESAWKALGGGGLRANKAETYQTKFVRSPFFGDSGVVNDRGFDLGSRGGIPTARINYQN